MSGQGRSKYSRKLRNARGTKYNGWGASIREKVSIYAEKGFQYEVRLTEYWCSPYRGNPGTHAHDDLLTRLKSVTDCKITGRNIIKDRQSQFRVRVFFRTEDDLMYLRLLTEQVFRVYRLVPPPLDS